MSRIRLAIVVAEFNKEITNEMLEIAISHSKKLNMHIKKICHVPGTFDMPLVVEKLLKKEQIDVVVTLGAVIKGETGHDQVIANNTARLLSNLSLKYQKPVTLGITGPDMTLKQAKQRAKIVPKRAVEAAHKMVTRLLELEDNEENGSQQ
ncbi:MAG: 6,7-dimethyl-8-ribityllumazine synthase [Nitrososphaeraceae archaeon]|nr:6,7-dimethyl-8-ribityllumazine synthase [Nitrososphaeraceae archaeon]MDW0226842.1 6,7-dimethyl-8-ribityllumazine synthase [Nitrososphaeraceae archaeon]MDW0237139.1 6,7-dimethyl-8-ribityllumazine synthase [Nitrososphaeraceae archaeon]MDW0288805.1 6,7-dimethyl-8-ribityllumazine synthase [Nitrososphaeraceae archaeon]